MKVPIDDVWMLPWTVLVERELAVTLPEVCCLARLVLDQVLEAGVGALVGGGLRVRDVAGDVLQREGLRLHAGHRGREGVEDTHSRFLLSVRAAAGTDAKHMAAFPKRPSQALCH